MSESTVLDTSVSIDEGSELRVIMDEKNTADGVMREGTSASPHIDISTTTAAIAAAQVALLQSTVSIAGQHSRGGTNQSGLGIVETARKATTSAPAPLQNIQHQQSTAPGQSPGRDVSSHDLGGLSSTTFDLPPPTPTQICLCQQPARIPRPRNGKKAHCSMDG